MPAQDRTTKKTNIGALSKMVNSEYWLAELDRVSLLTDREAEVFTLLGAGFSNRKISACLGVTEATVKAHMAQILEKLRVESRLQAGLVSHVHQTSN